MSRDDLVHLVGLVLPRPPLVPLAGALPRTRKLNAGLALGPAGVVGAYRLSPDGTLVVYLADERTDGLDELFQRYQGKIAVESR